MNWISASIKRPSGAPSSRPPCEATVGRQQSMNQEMGSQQTPVRWRCSLRNAEKGVSVVSKRPTPTLPVLLLQQQDRWRQAPTPTLVVQGAGWRGEGRRAVTDHITRPPPASWNSGSSSLVLAPGRLRSRALCSHPPLVPCAASSAPARSRSSLPPSCPLSP